MKGLKALVIGLGILIVLGTALVIGVVIKRFTESTGTSRIETPAVAHRGPFGTVLPGDGGGRIAGIAASGGVIAVWVKDGKGGRIDVIDPHTGALLGTATVK